MTVPDFPVDLLVETMALVSHELLLFSAVFILIFGLDDLLLDAIWLGSRWRGGEDRTRPDPDWRRGPRDCGTMAVFVPAWCEAPVLSDTLSFACEAWDGDHFRVFVGCYCNDIATIACASAVAAVDPRVRIVLHPDPGPTTKADCLNHLWLAMVAEEDTQGIFFSGVVLHDAEDRVHPDELRLIGYHFGEHGFVQIPVAPIAAPGNRWISGHYCDEFAEAHHKELPVRQMLRAPVPAAGVGCGFRRDALLLLAAAKGTPFDGDSLVEDYEVGLRLGSLGISSRFIRAHDQNGRLVTVRSLFPEDLSAAVRQKSRWITGIALAGWDRVGWSGRTPTGCSRVADNWMRWRDRRSVLAAVTILGAYVGFVGIGATALLASLSGVPVPRFGDATLGLLAFNGALLMWRLAMRFTFTARLYGPREGMRGILRSFVSNIVAVLASYRAATAYLATLRGVPLLWDKTDHRALGATLGDRLILAERIP